MIGGILKPSPAWRGWQGEALTGVEGTPDDKGRARFYRIARLPSSVRAFGPATFPGGEGFLRRGLRASKLMFNF